MIVKKASKRLHILRVLKRAEIPPHELILIYYALIRSVLEYCCIVWHNNLPAYLADSIERVQKRALNIILPGRSYYIRSFESAPLFSPRWEMRCFVRKNDKKITDGNRLSYFSPQTRENVNYDLCNSNNWSLFKCRTDRFQKSFSPSMIRVLNMSSWHIFKYVIYTFLTSKFLNCKYSIKYIVSEPTARSAVRGY
jgi:hypothetical protein